MEHHDPLNIVGTTVGEKYEIEAVVGEGGFGIVYRAIHLRFDSPVAIKVLRMARHLSAERRQRVLELFHVVRVGAHAIGRREAFTNGDGGTFWGRDALETGFDFSHGHREKLARLRLGPTSRKAPPR